MAVKYHLLFMLLVFNLSLAHGNGKNCFTYPSREAGKCISLEQCSRLYTIRKNPHRNANDVQILRKSICTTKPTVTVCCEQPKAPDLPSNCGRLSGGAALQDFIVGGEDSSWWPWIALLFTKNQFGVSTHFCGGTLINQQYVLTAAHCIKADRPIEFVRFGELDISSYPNDTYKGQTAPPPQDIAVAETIIHPQYQNPCRHCRGNDVALLKLEFPVDYNDFVGPICLPLNLAEMGYSDNRFEGEEATTAGWGKITAEFWDNRLANHLQQIHIGIKTTGWCRERIRDGSLPAGSILCAGNGDGKDTCRGDSGGPLMLANPNGTKYYLVGVTSFGSLVCGLSNSQGIYSRVTYYLPWILETIGSTTTKQN